MGIITGVAYFVACSKCGLHGKLVFPARGRTEKVSSKEWALEVIEGERYSPDAPLSKEEYVFLKEQIRLSSMPEEKPILESILEAEVELLSHLEHLEAEEMTFDDGEERVMN